MAGPVPEFLCSSRAFVCRAPLSYARSRSFTSSTARRKQGVFPTFPQTSSPDLDALLSTFRTNIFLPSHLPRRQRSLIYRPALQHHLLGDDPIIIDLPTKPAGKETESFTLVPLDHLKDEPSTKAAFHKLLNLFTTKGDWNVLPTFLEGLKGSGRKVTQRMAEKIARHATEAGRIRIIIQCLQMVDRTGIKLDNVNLAREVMLGSLGTAIRGGWSDESLAKAAKQAEEILDLMEDPGHTPSKEASKMLDPRQAPDIVAVAMGLVAVRAAKASEATDLEGKVEKHARKVLDLWKNAEITSPITTWWDANRELIKWGPVEQAMVVALQVLGEESDTGGRLATVLKRDVQPLVETAKNVLLTDGAKKRQRRGMIMYEELARALP
ncbi:hypothetical protein MMC13_004477 [Lambiella insularis]|nr:hypothetical protein [Lambiella insularis]